MDTINAYSAKVKANHYIKEEGWQVIDTKEHYTVTRGFYEEETELEQYG